MSYSSQYNSGGGDDAQPVDRNIKKPWNEVRYKDMDPKAKAEIRKQERDFKKDRDRTMGYFNSVSKAIADVTSSLEDGSMDQQAAADAFHAIADGFLTEFQKKIKIDVTIFRNSSACRVMEMVCTKCDLTQTKTFMYILLGKVGDLMHSPTASFVFETILAALYRNLGILMASSQGKGGMDDMLGELQLAEQGGAGHGLPPTHDLLTSWVEEACECMESLVVDVPGSRSLRTFVMMLSGRPIRNVPLPPNPPQFPDLLMTLFDAAVGSIEAVYTGAAEQARLNAAAGDQGDDAYANPYQKKAGAKGTISVSEAWYNACCANTSGAVIQALLQVDTEEVLTTKINRLYLRGQSVMQLLLDNIIGSRVIQSLVRSGLAVPSRAAADANNSDNALGDQPSAGEGEGEEGSDEAAVAVARWGKVLDMVLHHPKLDEIIATPGAVIEKLSYEHPEAVGGGGDTEGEGGNDSSHLSSSLHEAGEAEEEGEEGEGSRENIGKKRSRGSTDDTNEEEVAQHGRSRSNRKDKPSGTNSGLNVSVSPLFFLIQDLITFCPDAEHLQTLWDELLSPRLNALVSNAEYGVILTKFTRKCAFHGINTLAADASAASGEEGSPAAKATNHIQQGQLEEPNVKADIANGAIYFTVPAQFKESIVSEICRALKQRCAKGAAQALMVEKILGDLHSAAVSYNLLSMGAKPSAYFFNAVDKLNVEDLVSASTSAAGACVFQRFILTAAARDALSSTSIKTISVPVAPAPKPNPKTGHHPKGKGAPPAAGESSPAAATTIVKKDAGSLIRFVRRICPHLPTLVVNKYAGYVVECAYEQASVEGKEEIVKHLTDFYQAIINEDNALRSERKGGAVGFGAVYSLDPISRSIAKKVMVKCCVEQYVHRRADWLKLAERQSNVKRMMMQILANDTL